MVIHGQRTQMGWCMLEGGNSLGQLGPSSDMYDISRQPLVQPLQPVLAKTACKKSALRPPGAPQRV